MSDDYFAWSREAFALDRVFAKPEALRAVRILELATLALGPVTASYLAEFGAEVIKVELPGIGDPLRSITPQGPSGRRPTSLPLLVGRNSIPQVSDPGIRKREKVGSH